MDVSSLNHTKLTLCLAVALRTVRAASTLPCVSLPGTKKPAHSRPVLSLPGRYTPWHGSLSRPIIRTYSAEVTSSLSNLPHHRRLCPYRHLVMIQQHPRVCQAHFFKKPTFLPESALCSLCPGKFGRPLAKSALGEPQKPDSTAVIVGGHRGPPLHRVTMALVGADLCVGPSTTGVFPWAAKGRPHEGYHSAK